MMNILCMKVNKKLPKTFVNIETLRLFVVLCCGLDAGNCSGTYDIFGATTSGQVINRLGKPLGDRAISFSLGKSLGNLVCDVSSVKIREYEDIGLACNRASWCL